MRYNNGINWPYLGIRFIRFLEKHRRIHIFCKWKHDSVLRLYLKDSYSIPYEYVNLGINIDPKLMGDFLPINSLNKYNRGTLRSHRFVKINISLKELVDSLFIFNHSINDNNFIINVKYYDNMGILTQYGRYIKKILINNQPLCLWGHLCIIKNIKRHFPIVFGSTQYNIFKKQFVFNLGKGTGLKILQFMRQSKYLLCQKVFSNRLFLNPIFDNGFLTYYNGKTISGNKFIKLAETYQSNNHSNNDLYRLGFRDYFSGYKDDSPFDTFQNYKDGCNDVKMILKK